MENDLERLEQEVKSGNAAAFIPLADALEEAGHPHGPELQELAITIATDTEWAVVMAAIAVFNELYSQK